MDTVVTGHTIDLSEMFVGMTVEITFAESSELKTGRSYYMLTWDDGVANEWREFYPELHQAMARVAVLAYLDVETTGEGQNRGMTNSEKSLAEDADRFVREQTAEWI